MKLQRRLLLHETALNLVERQGLTHTTVAEICEVAEVSPRTFFNYFPSKAAAALNLPEHAVSPEAAAMFSTASGELIPALCDLVANSIIANSIIAGSEVARLKKLVSDHPELLPTLNEWVVDAKDEFASLVRPRTESTEAAAAALTLTLSAVRLLNTGSAPAPNVCARLRATVDRIISVHHLQMTAPPD